MAKTYEQHMQDLRAGIPQGGTQSSKMKPIQQGVDLDTDLDMDSDQQLADLDMNMGTDPAGAVDKRTRTQPRQRQPPGVSRPGGSATHVPGSTSSSRGGAYGGATTGGATTAGTRGGGKGGKLPPTKKPENLEEYENRMVAEYVKVGEGVVRNAHGDGAAQDFLLDEDAQREFAEKAALQSFNEMDAAAEGYAAESRTIGGAEVEVFVFPDGSEYYVSPDADINNLQPGDVIRTELPSSAR